MLNPGEWGRTSLHAGMLLSDQEQPSKGKDRSLLWAALLKIPGMVSFEQVRSQKKLDNFWSYGLSACLEIKDVKQ